MLVGFADCSDVGLDVELLLDVGLDVELVLDAGLDVELILDVERGLAALSAESLASLTVFERPV